MRNILLLISMLGLLPAGCGRTVSDTDTVSCDTFVYSVKGGDSLRLDRYTDTPAAEIDAKKPCMIFVFGVMSDATLLRSSVPSGSHSMNFSAAPVRRQTICHGRRLL